MPRRSAAGETSPEELAHLLDALGPRAENLVDKDAWQAFMTERFTPGHGFGELSELAVERSWEAGQQRIGWMKEGFRPYTFKSIIEPSLRFGIKGYKGSFGVEKARAIWQADVGTAPPF